MSPLRLTNAGLDAPGRASATRVCLEVLSFTSPLRLEGAGDPSVPPGA